MPQEPKTTGCAKVSSTVPRQNHAQNITTMRRPLVESRGKQEAMIGVAYFESLS